MFHFSGGHPLYRNPITECMRKRKAFADSNLDLNLLTPETHQISSSLQVKEFSVSNTSIDSSAVTGETFSLPGTNFSQFQDNTMYSVPMFSYFFNNPGNHLAQTHSMEFSLNNQRIEHFGQDTKSISALNDPNDGVDQTENNSNQTYTFSDTTIPESLSNRTIKPKLSFSIEAIIGIK